MAESFDTIIGELCDCGHEKADHKNALGGIAPGHGECGKCDCIKFTWASFIFAGEEAETTNGKGEDMD